MLILSKFARIEPIYTNKKNNISTSLKPKYCFSNFLKLALNTAIVGITINKIFRPINNSGRKNRPKVVSMPKRKPLEGPGPMLWKASHVSVDDAVALAVSMGWQHVGVKVVSVDWSDYNSGGVLNKMRL